MYTKLGRVIIILISILFISTSLVSRSSSDKPVLSTTLYVGGDGPGNYTSIQDAIDDSISGGTVFVYDDSSPYLENLILNNPVLLIGENKNTTIIDGNGGSYVINIISDGNTITGFTIENCSDSDGAGIIINAADTNLSNNIIKNNDYYGIYITTSSLNTLVYHNNFIGNTNHAYDGSDSSIWDNGYPSGGNYWDDHVTPDNNHSINQNLTGFDFIVDNPNIIDGVNNNDRWPWTIPNGWEKPYFSPNTIIVKFYENISEDVRHQIISQYNTEILQYLFYLDSYILTINTVNQSEFDIYYQYNNNSSIESVCLDLYAYIESSHLTEPNDECYPKQWHLKNTGVNTGVPTGLIDADIDAPQSWEHWRDCRWDLNGNDFVIAIIDSGVDLHHPDLQGNLWVNPIDVAGDSNADGFPGDQGVDDDGDGTTDFDDYQDILSRLTNINEDDDEDGFINEDPVNGADDDGDGRIDEDPAGDANGDGWPGAQGVDEDGDGTLDYNDASYLAFIRGTYDFENDDDENGVPDDIHGADFVNFMPDGSPDDENGHGTHCAGIICAQGDNTIGITGVCWRAQLIAVRAMNERGRFGIANFERSVNYVIWARTHNINVRIISFSGGWVNPILDVRNGFQNAIQQLNNNNILFITAAGNNGQDLDGGFDVFPAECTNPNIIRVASSDNKDRLSVFSNWGDTTVDLVAPGENILSLAMHGRYVYNDSNNNNHADAGDQRLTSIPAIFPAGSTVEGNDGDTGNNLINFNVNERHDGSDNIYDEGEHIYRDVDGDGNVSPGDIRLSHIYINNQIRYTQHSVVQAGDLDNGTALHPFSANEQHVDYRPVNNQYDPGEPIYRDVDNSSRVSTGDIRLTNRVSFHRNNSPVQAVSSDNWDCLQAFAGNERHTEFLPADGEYDNGEVIYRDNDNNNIVSPGDQRLTPRTNPVQYPAGSFVQPGDADIGLNLVNFRASEKYSLLRYMSGTSMATPMVAGSTAQFWCHFPDLTINEVKNWILRKVDPRKTFFNMVISGKYNDGRHRMISGFDFGDAPDPLTANGQYPTILWHELSHGASHEDISEEFLGFDVSGEYDANVEWPWDPDNLFFWGTSNLEPSRSIHDPHPPYQAGAAANLDFYDDGVSLPSIVFKGGIYEIKFLIRTEHPFINDVDNGRYDEFQTIKRDEKKIYINAYFDWNLDGDWDDGGEHLVKCPVKQCTWWGGPDMICCYGINWTPPSKTALRKTTFPVPFDANDTIWVRVRLDYGENVGRPPWPRYESGHPFHLIGEILHDTYAHAQYGEVEDYIIHTVEKIKLIGEPKYDNGDISYVTSETPFELIDMPLTLSPYITNYYRLWYEDFWTDWIYYNDGDIFLLEGEGPHQIEFYGQCTQTMIPIYQDFETGYDHWEIIDHDQNGCSWEWTNITPFWADESINDTFMLIDDSSSEFANKDSFISPELTTMGLTHPYLTFRGQFSAVRNEKLYVNISTDFGETWTNLMILTGISPTFETWTIDLADIVSDEVFLIKFTYDDENELGLGMIISDISILGDEIIYSPIYSNYHIVDNTPPIITEIMDMPIVKTNQIPVTISCDVTDQYSGVNTAMCNISGPPGFEQINISMTDRSYQYTTMFSIPGTYTYFIWANDSLYHNITSETYSFQIFAPPTANFTFEPLNPKTYEMIQFTDTSIDIDGSIVNWTWDFDDGNISYLQHPSHIYDTLGNYSVCLTVKDNDDFTNISCMIITILPPDDIIDINQSIQDRGFPIRHALDGDWGAGQNFIPTLNTFTKAEIYLRKFGTPEFDLVIELREDAINGPLLDLITIPQIDIPSTWTWIEVDFTDITVNPEMDYFIKCPPAPSGVTTSFGYEWGYAFGNQYDDGAFWFTRDGGGLWRDLPTMYEFVFKTYGYN